MRAALLALLCLTGCYQSFEIVDAVDAGACSGTPPTCVTRNADPCAGGEMTEAICTASGSYSCPTGSRIFRAVEGGGSSPCRPFHDASLGIRLVAGSIPRVPTPDGRCLWIADSVTPRDGPEISNVAFVPDLTAPYGTCPTSAPPLGGRLHDAVVVDGTDPGVIVQITGGWLERGATVVSYRLFHFDPMGGFGVTEDGTGLGRWDAATETIHVPGAAGLTWPTTIDLGDAYLPARDERSYTYLWGCPPPIHDLVEDCVMARRDAMGATEYFTRTGWSTLPGDLALTFSDGPWLSAVTTSVHGYSQVYTVGFGSELRQHVATFPYGPWSDGGTIAHCDVPASDGHSYCAGPVVHEELDDPTRSDDMAITYGLGTTDMPGERIAADPDAYWTRLVWAHAP